MSQDDLAYYRRRAFEERERAAHADNPEAANVHQALARRYEKIVARAEMPPLTRGEIANQNERPSGPAIKVSRGEPGQLS